MNDCAIILLGATGDLARHKIFPALYHLFTQNKLGRSIIIGAALDDINAQELHQRIKKTIKPDDEQRWQDFCKNVFYQSMNFTNEKDFETLNKVVIEQEKKAKLSGNRLLYCATAPYFYCTITTGLANSGLAKRMEDASTGSARTGFSPFGSMEAPKEPNGDLSTRASRSGFDTTLSTHHRPSTSLADCPERAKGESKEANGQKQFHRIVYEKPFGHDLESAHQINLCIKQHFEEHQIFRIDHYLTKELVGNIALVRFTNIVFEPLWNNRYIDQVQIVFDEKVCLEGRGAFYDKYGALADVMQNHMMQLVALIGMESPEKLTGEYIRSERAKVLQKVKVVDALLGQFKGYTSEHGVAPDSKTETFAQVMLRIENPRWAGVPFYLKVGKCLDKKETAIYIKFKHVDCLLAKACPSEPNYLTIEISPDPLFALTLNAKKPGKSDEVMPVQMQFAHDTFNNEMPEAYETLFEEILKGEQSVSVRFDEIEYAWKIIDAVRALKPPLYLYEPQSKGPQEAKTQFDQKHGLRWYSPRKSIDEGKK